MAIYLGESTVLPIQPHQQSVSITKKISNYIFRFEDKIGQGNFSKVYKGFHQMTNEQVAIKIIELSSVKSAKLQELLFSEIEVIQSLNHPNILKCHEVLKSENNCYIITQLCNGGDLQSVLKKEKCLNQISAAPYIRDIFKGLLYLGQRGIVHRDLKIANIFLHNGVCKIADFGFAKYTNKQMFHLYSQNFFDLDIGSPLYMSPEGMIEHMYGMKTDVWSFGIILFELLHGKTPFSSCVSEYELKRAVVTPISYHSIRPDLSPQIRQLIFKCLIVDSVQRPDAISLKNDPFLFGLLNGFMKENLQMKKSDSHFVYSAQQSLPIQNHQNQMPQQFGKVETMTSSTNRMVNQSFNMQPVQTSVQYLNPYLIPQTTARYMQSPSQPQIQVSLQVNTNSPARSNHSFGNQSKQASIRDSQNKEQLQIPDSISSRRIQHSPSSNSYPRSYDNIQTNSYIDLIPQINYPKNGNDRILVPQEKNEKEKLSINDNFDKMSNSSWSYDNTGKKKFAKALSHQNINKIQNNLGMVNSQHKVKESLNTSINARVQSSFQATNSKQTPQKSQNSGSYRPEEKSVNQSFNQRVQTNPSQKLHFKEDRKIKQKNNSSFKEQINKSPKKFGELIKGEKKTDSNIKSIIKLEKMSDPDQSLIVERTKTKSHIKFDQPSNGNVLQLPGKTRTARHSFGDISSSNHSEYMNQSFNMPPARVQRPIFIQEKEQHKQELKRNLICTVMEFKEAVGFLHYCRLYYRFVAMLKKVVLFPQVKKYDFLAKCFKSCQEHVQVYERYLLTALNELIQNIKCKEIIYDGDSYKKKKVKEDKLKEVTEEYFKKYMEEVNRSRTQHHKIIPIYMKSTSLSFMRERNEQFWESLDREYNNVVQLSRRTSEIGENFIKVFRNLCYFGIRINEANQIISNCMELKDYKLLADATLQNWLAQEYYGEDIYFKLKNDRFRKINASSAMKNSETNDTETENQSRAKYL